MSGLMTDTQQSLLRTMLLIAVPMHIDKLCPLTPMRRCEIAHQCADVVAQHGDDLQAGGGHCAEAFNALARGLAAAALTAPGGVDALGGHWCADPWCRAASRFDHADTEQAATDDPEPITTPRQVADVIRDLADYLTEGEAA
ncbi:hypothetical protein JBE04_18055 [Streptomyces sp. PRKS01-29]|nr:hypothetical protein [Streptomyces sabulosicollis]MBI0296316.1 hypothetical protein [Streptomyces sabulosicollis]